MAAIDKIHGDRSDYNKIKEFLTEKREDCIRVTGCDPLKYMYNPDYWDSDDGPITNFPSAIDAYLYQLPDLIKSLKRGIECQYDEDWLKDVINRVPPYDWSEWKYEVATKFKFDFKEYKWKYMKNWDRLPLSRSYYSIDAYYKDKLLWFNDDNHWIIPERYQLRNGRDDGGMGSAANVRVHTVRALRRWIRKQRFPKGTYLRISTLYVGGNFMVHCI